MNKNQKFLVNFIYFSFVFSIVYVMGNAIQLDINILYKISLVVFIIALVKFLIYHPLVIPTVLTIALILSALINRYVSEFIPVAINRLSYFLKNILQNLRGNGEVFQENILCFWIIIVFIFAIFTSYFLFKRKKPWLLLFIYLPIFIYYWYMFFDEALYLMAMFLVSFIALIGLNSYIKQSEKISNSHNYDIGDIYPNWRRTVLRYAISIVLIAMVIPKNSDYLAWPWLNERVRSVFPQIEELRASEKYSRRSGEATLFDFSSTGFMGEDKKLGGPVELSDKLVMTVLSSKSIYLRGNVKEKYTGFSWIAKDKSYTSYSLGEDFTDLSDEEKSLYYQQEDITITNNLFASTRIFSPYRPYKVFSNDKYSIFVDSNNTIKASSGIYKDGSYLVRVQTPLPYGKLKAAGIDRKIDEIEDLDDYLQVPNNISERTIALTREIVEEKQSDFEKAKTIEGFLRKSYEYNLDVEEVPGNSEFVDYFLFEGQEGYCTYYASSMALMLRLQGIPSRYIEGYLVKDSIEDGKYQVSQKNAHAWVEAFIEPVGWMIFEATPAFSISPRYEDYGILPLDTEITEDREDIELEDFESLGGSTGDEDEDIQDDGDIGIYTRPQSQREFNYQYTLFTVIGLIILSLVLNIMWKIWNIGKNKRHFKKLSKTDKVIYLYRDIAAIISELGYPQLPGETHFEYADRVNYKFHDIRDTSIREVTDIFVKSKYGSYLPIYTDVKLLLNYKKELENRLKNSLGKIKYYYRKLIKYR